MKNEKYRLHLFANVLLVSLAKNLSLHTNLYFSLFIFHLIQQVIASARH